MKEIILSTKLRYCPRFRIHFAFLLPESIVSYLTLPYPILSLFFLCFALCSHLSLWGRSFPTFVSPLLPLPLVLSLSHNRVRADCYPTAYLYLSLHPPQYTPIPFESSPEFQSTTFDPSSNISSVNILRPFILFQLPRHNSISTTRTTLLLLHTQLYFYYYAQLYFNYTHNSTSTAHTQLYY